MKMRKSKGSFAKFYLWCKNHTCSSHFFFLRREFLTDFKCWHYLFFFFWKDRLFPSFALSLKNHMLSWSLNNNITSLVTLICFLILEFHEVQTFFVLIFSFPSELMLRIFVVSSMEPWFLVGQFKLSCREQLWELHWFFTSIHVRSHKTLSLPWEFRMRSGQIMKIVWRRLRVLVWWGTGFLPEREIT